MSLPIYCRREAYERFRVFLPDLQTNDGLLGAAYAIALHAMPDAAIETVNQRLAELAGQIRGRVRSNHSDALLAHLHEVLFEEQRFGGALDDYYEPRNSFLPWVLEIRRGLPIVVSLVYKCVAERLGLRVHGVNSPGHFLTAVENGGELMFVDPFFSGVILTRDEAYERIASATGEPVSNLATALECCTHRQWVSRMLNNLQAIYAYRQQFSDLVAMQELQALLFESE